MDKMRELWILTKLLNTSILENKNKYETNRIHKIEVLGTVELGMR